jgi:hypothetical protein
MNSPLKILSNIVSGGLERRLTCGACGKEFFCCVSLKGCWCSEIKLNEDTIARLRSSYTDCLCRECLERAQSEDTRNG